jgi:hypothetical protein
MKAKSASAITFPVKLPDISEEKLREEIKKSR